MLICCELTLALDVSVQAAVLNLLAEFQATKQVSYILISQDLGIVRYLLDLIAVMYMGDKLQGEIDVLYLLDPIAVMYMGEILEIGPAQEVFSGPHHPYTAALLSSVPTIMAGEPLIEEGQVVPLPLTSDRPKECIFQSRCPRRIPGLCDVTRPLLIGLAKGHSLSCHLAPEELPTAASKQSSRAVVS